MKKQWFKSVDNQERKIFVRDMFNDISGKYDLMNRIMTSGIDKAWRKQAIKQLEINRPDGKVLDLACGTGDMTFEYLQKFPRGEIFALDFAEKMLAEFSSREKFLNYRSHIRLIQGDAEQLPFRDNSFDGATMAFGIRNVPDVSASLKECLRVLKPGAKFVILEITQAPNKLVNRVYQWYFHKIVPWIGTLISGNNSAYSYLPSSVDVFYSPNDFFQLMNEAGFIQVTKKPLSLGTVHLFVGEKEK